MINLRLKMFACLAFSMLCSGLSLAQKFDDQGMKPFASFHGGDIDKVNVENGNLFLKIPLYSLPQRGALALSYSFVHNNKNFQVLHTVSNLGKMYDTWQVQLRPDPYQVFGGTIVFDQALGVSVTKRVIETDCQPASGDMPSYCVDVDALDYVLKEPNGTGHPLAYTGSSFRAADGSGYTFVPSYSNPDDPFQAAATLSASGTVTDSSGTAFTVGANGGRIQDIDGNWMNAATRPILDTILRSVPQSTARTGSCPNLNLPFQPSPSSGNYLDFPGPNGTTTSVLVCQATVRVHTNFFGGAGTRFMEFDQSRSIIQSIVLADGTYWSFQYDAADPNVSGSIGYGDLVKVTLPTGGSISYSYTSSEGCVNSEDPDSTWSRSISQRVVDDGAGHVSTWNYAIGGSGTSIVTDPNQNSVIYTFANFGDPTSCSYYETNRQYFSGGTVSVNPALTVSGGTVVKSVATSGYLFTTNSSGSIIAAFPQTVTTTLDDNSSFTTSSQYNSSFATVEQQCSLYGGETCRTAQGTAYYGQVNSVTEQDFSGSVLRRTAIGRYWETHPSYLAQNLLNLLEYQTVTSGTQSVSSTANSTTAGSNQQVSKTMYRYDEFPLQSSGVTTQFSANASTIRGHQTSMEKWLSGASDPVWHTYWYDTGGVYQQEEPKDPDQTKTRVTTLHYDPSTAGAYLLNSVDPLGHTTTFSYDFNTGLKLSDSDPNGHKTSYQYDSMLRVKEIDESPAEQNTTATVTFNYLPNSVTITQQAGTTVELDVDGLGRLVHRKVDPQDEVQTYISYDLMGRKYSATNAYRQPSGEETNGTTYYSYDALGRNLQITNPDGTTVATKYTGSATSVTDEGNGRANVVRVSQSDALGRLRSVCEQTGSSPADLSSGSPAPTSCGQAIAATGFLTRYEYDPLGNLVQVNQGSQLRSMVYNTDGSLQSATNPETGTLSYSYLPSGRVWTRTRPSANVLSGTATTTTTYHYNGDGALDTESYSDGTTPTVKIEYGNSAQFGVSGLTNTVDRPSASYVVDSSGNLIAGEILSYSGPGRVKQSNQCFGANCATMFPKVYSYSDAGDLLSFSNAGTTFTYGYDGAQRLTSLTSSLNDAHHPGTLFSNPTYSPNGSLRALTIGEGLTDQTVFWHYDNRLRTVSKTVTGPVLASGTATVSINQPSGGLQSIQQVTHSATPGSATASVSGSEQSTTVTTQAATRATGSFTINGGEQYTVPCPPCIRTNKVWDRGTVTVSIGASQYSVSYAQNSTDSSVAAALASAISAGGLATTSLSDNTVSLTAVQAGTSGNLSGSVSSKTSDPTDFSDPSFYGSASGMSGGKNATTSTVYDSGTVVLTVNGTPRSVSYGNGDSASTVASKIAAALAGSPVTAAVSGTTITLTSTSSGAGTNYPLSVSSTWDTAHFSSPSFALAAPASLSSGTDNQYQTIYDSGTVSVTLNNVTKTVSYNQSTNSNASAIASALSSQFAGVDNSVSVSVSGNVLSFISNAGPETSYTLNSSFTYDTAHFGSGSFQPATSSGTLSGGSVTGNASIYAFSLGYNPNSTLQTANDSVNGNWTYQYDEFNRLWTATSNQGKGCQWSYDLYGNRVAQSVYSGSCNTPITPVSNTRNQVDGFTYDLSGNLINAPSPYLNHSMTYDAENRVVSGDAATFYVYDSGGRRVAKKNSSGAITSYYLYDEANRVVAEINGSGSVVRQEIYAGALHLGAYQGGSTFFTHSDWLGTERLRTDVNGNACQTITNQPFGDQAVTSGSCNPSPTFFTGKERDTETGLDYFGARYYASNMGRFSSPDPSGLLFADLTDPQSLNLYSYVRNNPLINADPSGLDCVHINNDTGEYEGFESGDCDNSTEKSANSGYYIDGKVNAISFNGQGQVIGYDASTSSGMFDSFAGSMNSNIGPAVANLNPYTNALSAPGESVTAKSTMDSVQLIDPNSLKNYDPNRHTISSNPPPNKLSKADIVRWCEIAVAVQAGGTVPGGSGNGTASSSPSDGAPEHYLPVPNRTNPSLNYYQVDSNSMKVGNYGAGLAAGANFALCVAMAGSK